MMIELDAAQAAVVHEILNNRLSNISSEIRHTDSPRFRDELREEREVLRAVLNKLQVPAA